MKRYIIHLHTEYYDAKPKENKAATEAGQLANDENAKKKFLTLMQSYAKTNEIALVSEKYEGQSSTTAVFLDISEDNLEKIIDVLRALDIVSIIEPRQEPWLNTKAEKSDKKKDVSRFLK